MPAWIAAALRLLAQGVGLGVGVEAGSQFLDRDTGDAFGDFVDFGQIGTGVGGIPRFGRIQKKRRRRRRALTASDRADIAFVAGMISKAAAKDFAVQLAARPR